MIKVTLDGKSPLAWNLFLFLDKELVLVASTSTRLSWSCRESRSDNRNDFIGSGWEPTLDLDFHKVKSSDLLLCSCNEGWRDERNRIYQRPEAQAKAVWDAEIRWGFQHEAWFLSPKNRQLYPLLVGAQPPWQDSAALSWEMHPLAGLRQVRVQCSGGCRRKFETFEKLDADSSGGITCAEFIAAGMGTAADFVNLTRTIMAR